MSSQEPNEFSGAAQPEKISRLSAFIFLLAVIPDPCLRHKLLIVIAI